MSFVSTAVDVGGPEPGEPVSLYLDLEPGQRADLEVVARTSLAFAAALKELAYVLDPSIEVRVELQSGTEGSLSLNSIIRVVRRTTSKPISLKALAATVLIWFANDIRTYGVIETLNHVFKPAYHLSDDDIQKIAAEVERALRGNVAGTQVRQVYRELQGDPAIKGVGATITPTRRPSDIVPRDLFIQRGGEIVALLPDTQPRIRTKTSREIVTLISPVLLPRDRRWKFYIPHLGEFGASIKDEKFLASLLSGRRKIPMRAGIQLDVILDTIEEKEAEVWVVKDRSIRHVNRVRRQRLTPDLFTRITDSNDEED